MRIYVAGPMRNIPEFNFPAFNYATRELREVGHTVFNPAERDCAQYGSGIAMGNMTGDIDVAVEQHGFDLREALREDLAWICREAEAIAVLPGWEMSKGARAEVATGEALGIRIYRIEELI